MAIYLQKNIIILFEINSFNRIIILKILVTPRGLAKNILTQNIFGITYLCLMNFIGYINLKTYVHDVMIN